MLYISARPLQVGRLRFVASEGATVQRRLASTTSTLRSCDQRAFRMRMGPTHRPAFEEQPVFRTVVKRHISKKTRVRDIIPLTRAVRFHFNPLQGCSLFTHVPSCSHLSFPAHTAAIEMRLVRQHAAQSHLRPNTAGMEWLWISIVASRSSKHAPFTPVCLRLAPQFMSTSVHSKLAGPPHRRSVTGIYDVVHDSIQSGLRLRSCRRRRCHSVRHDCYSFGAASSCT